MSKHTPGPWSPPSDQYPEFVMAEDDQMLIAEVRGLGYLTSVQKLIPRDAVKVQCANARLIAAAPDMLEELKRCLGLVDEEDYHRILELIAKAEGLTVEYTGDNNGS